MIRISMRANPAAGRSISSTFGVRTDPLIGTPALHSGMDFRAPYGSPARATAGCAANTVSSSSGNRFLPWVTTMRF